MFTAALPKKYRKDLIAKLERLSSKYFSFEMPKIDMEINDRVQNNDIKQYIVNPYQLFSMNGHPYLICNLPKYDDLTHFRLDRIKNSKFVDTPAKPLRKLRGFEASMRLSEYLSEHPNLWNGKQFMFRQVSKQCSTGKYNLWNWLRRFHRSP